MIVLDDWRQGRHVLSGKFSCERSEAGETFSPASDFFEDSLYDKIAPCILLPISNVYSNLIASGMPEQPRVSLSPLTALSGLNISRFESDQRRTLEADYLPQGGYL